MCHPDTHPHCLDGCHIDHGHSRSLQGGDGSRETEAGARMQLKTCWEWGSQHRIDFRFTKSGYPKFNGLAEEMRGGIFCFQSPHSSCLPPKSTFGKFSCVSDLNPECFRFNHGSLPGMAEETSVSVPESSSTLSGLYPFSRGSIPLLGSPQPPFQAECFSS